MNTEFDLKNWNKLKEINFVAEKIKNIEEFYQSIEHDITNPRNSNKAYKKLKTLGYQWHEKK